MSCDVCTIFQSCQLLLRQMSTKQGEMDFLVRVRFGSEKIETFVFTIKVRIPSDLFNLVIRPEIAFKVSLIILSIYLV